MAKLLAKIHLSSLDVDDELERRSQSVQHTAAPFECEVVMGYEEAAPCRHKGAPPEDLINQVVDLLASKLRENEGFLSEMGLSQSEFDNAFPAAIEKLRGRTAAANSKRRLFAQTFMKFLEADDHVKSYSAPKYGRDTVHRLELASGVTVGIIQKGCPDGNHSTKLWTRPDWADELYLWWICDSQKNHPGEHIWKGVSRVQGKVSVETKNQLDGVIFFNDWCGGPERPCPKQKRVQVGELLLPPPCVYIFPNWSDGAENNWRGELKKVFPEILLKAFGLDTDGACNHVGYVGFKKSGTGVRTEIVARFGPGKKTEARG